MPSAQHSFVLIWKRVVAALTLIAAALIAPTAPVPVSGAGVAGSRAGSGPAIASTANALIAAVDGLAEGGERKPTLQEPDTSGPQGKPCVPAAWYELRTARLTPAAPITPGAAPLRVCAARAGRPRAPPRA
jgi:hypothetical protein